MNHSDNNRIDPYADKPLLTCFLHELTLARKQLSLYPADHPNVEKSTGKTLDILNDLLLSATPVVLGITPDALLFEQTWLDREDKVHKDFARFFSALGIATLSIHKGLTRAELTRFNQLLRVDRDTIESFGGFKNMLEQQQIDHIEIDLVDYDAFQAGRKREQQQQNIWETFLTGLQNGKLEFSAAASTMDIPEIADILNHHLSDADSPQIYDSSIERFVELQLEKTQRLPSQVETDRKLNSLLTHLAPQAQERFFGCILKVLDHNQDKAPNLLKKLPTQFLQGALARKAQKREDVSSRLLAMVKNLAEDSAGGLSRTIQGETDQLAPDMVRARLDVLFSEERQDLYMPENYQAALGLVIDDEINSSPPEETRLKLKQQLEEQPAEQNLMEILFDLLEHQVDSAQEQAIQQNLIDLSRCFLQAGDFTRLRDIYAIWSRYLYSEKSTVTIFEEQVLTHQTQSSFMAEVLDSFELLDPSVHEQIADYIITVGEPYSELLITQLGQAPTWEERKMWMGILEGIEGDAQDKILKALDDKRWYLVRNLLTVINKRLDPGSLRIIQKLCEHDHPKVRAEAIRTLFSCNPATANRQLLAELGKSDPEARLAAIEIADSSKDHSVLKLLHDTVLANSSSEQILQEQLEAVRTLTRIGNRESLAVLNRVISKQGLLPNRRMKKLQEEIIRNLADFPDERASELLKKHCRGKFKHLAKTVLEQSR